ncbi:MAG TPA: alpha/beta hydrolase-fold protein, partial [Blastocatellia bacterium]|nr:alpha/beta hydrolase-fold protein [Blastocatellia bacterium]
KATFIGFLMLIFSFSTLAQQPPRQPTPNDTLVSPEVHADKRVTFRIYAPKADEVTVGGDWISQGLGTGGKMIQDERGVWSITVGPLPADYYSYTITVDGVRTLDPKNAMIKQGVNTVDNMVFVPGAEADYQALKAVPHGEVRKVWYQSTTMNEQRRLHIYFPPGYDSSKAKYPVFYLLHGGGDEDSGWSTIGRAGFILDNLIAAQKAKPMIVVMPNGSLPRPPVVPGAPPDPAAQLAFQDRFVSELMKDIVPFVEKNYRVQTGAANRAIAGLSMGGGQTTRVISTNPDQFAYAAIWSAGVNPATAPDFEKRAALLLDNADKANKNFKLLSISCGEKDTLAINGSKNLDAILQKRNIKHEMNVSGGAHTWINWRQYLNAYAQKLFR